MTYSVADAAPISRKVLITGATGYLGRALIPALRARGHGVRALVRPASADKLSEPVETVFGSALEAEQVRRALFGCDTLVHLVGVPHPSPAKAQLFEEIDLPSIQASVTAVAATSPRPHLVYLSVAQPAPVMRAYLAVRAAGEALIREHRLDATCLRPWYVLGPGHRWPKLLLPVYAVLERIPPTRASALRLGFVTLPQMVRALVRAVETPAESVRIVEVPEIRRS